MSTSVPVHRYTHLVASLPGHVKILFLSVMLQQGEISVSSLVKVCLWISQQPTLFNHFTTYGNNIGNVKAILTAIVHVLRVTVLSTAYYIWSLPCLLQSSRVDMFCACWGFLRVPRHTFQKQTGDSLLATGQYVNMSTAHLRAVDLSKV